MNDSERDPAVIRAIDELRRLPRVDDARVERIVAAAAALRVTPAGDDPLARPSLWPRVWRVAGIAAAAAIVGFVIHGFIPSRPGGNVAAPIGAASPLARVAVNAALHESSALPIPHQFVLSVRGAKRVSVVGDFNEWNRASAPMARSADGTLWSTTVAMLPGRHMYGYIVDDSLFMLDPSQPKGRDPDLGAEGSVVIVGRP
jgi:AMP-activated protein kinase-like protein